MPEPIEMLLKGAASEIDFIERAMAEPWSDGLPMIPPTEGRVASFLDYAGATSGQEIASCNLGHVTARDLALSATMAGCNPEVAPLLVACLQGVMDPQFHINHLAGPDAPWPLFLVNGPVINQIGLNNSTYFLGPGNRTNMTIGRAISLTLDRCLGLRNGATQRGVLGNPSRAGGLVIGEREDSVWDPVSINRGFPQETSTVTVFSTFDGTPKQIYFGPEQMAPENRAEATADFIAYYFGEGYCGGGTQLVILPPVARQVFLDEGWSKEMLSRYLTENTKASVESLKHRFLWPTEPGQEATTECSAPIEFPAPR